jgi:hypothetical protein
MSVKGSLEKSELSKELEEVINRHSRENISNTPDFILAEFMKRCLEAGEYLIERREQWYGRENYPGVIHTAPQEARCEVPELPNLLCTPTANIEQIIERVNELVICQRKLIDYLRKEKEGER